MSGRKMWVRWVTRDERIIARIRKRFSMPLYYTVNGLTPCEIAEADMELLKETARRGHMVIFDAGWVENNGSYALISRKN